MIPQAWQDRAEKVEITPNQDQGELQPELPWKSTSYLEEDIGYTMYDLQTNASMQKRIHVFEDGTMGAVWMSGFQEPSFPDMGTGYNYFDGESWGPIPWGVLETLRSGWPEYAPFGENGEIIVSHISGSGLTPGLNILKREFKGTGDWEELLFLGPPECEDILWPRIATGGIDNSVIHLLAVTAPAGNCSVLYQGQEIALLYSRSPDGGASWDPENYVIPLIDSSQYYGFVPDVYDIRAEGNKVGILIGGPWIG